jgi:hypothetical protein
MKKLLVGAVLAGLAAAAFAQSAPAPQNQIDIGGGYYGTDILGNESMPSIQNGITGVNGSGTTVKNKFDTTSTKYGQGDLYSPSVNWNGRYTFINPVNADNTLKLSIADDGYYGLYTGNVFNAGGEQNQQTGVITPAVEWLGYGMDVTFGMPLYYYNNGDGGGINELKWAYKDASYLPGVSGSGYNSGYYPANTNNSIATNDIKVFYKYSFDKTTWVSGGFETLTAISPTPWLAAFKPKVSGGAFGTQLDVQFDDYNAYNNGGDAEYYDLYLEPKLTYDFGFLNLVSNLKAYVSSRISLATTNPSYNLGTSAATASWQPFHDTYVQPGVNYSYTFPQVGTFSIDAGWRFAKIDNSVSSSQVNDINPYSELRIALGYTYKF